jgi:hypothetical protein
MHSIFMLYPQCTLRAISCPSSTTHPSFFLGIEMREKVSYTVKSFFFIEMINSPLRNAFINLPLIKKDPDPPFLKENLGLPFLKVDLAFFFPFRKMMYF